jgi:hypothetical protein
MSDFVKPDDNTGSCGGACSCRATATMLIPPENKGQVSQQPLSRNSAINEAGRSGVPPPSFEESTGHLLVDIDRFVQPYPEEGEEPPEFTPYNAEHSVSKDGEIISHDRHLNEDGAWWVEHALILCGYISFRPPQVKRSIVSCFHRRRYLRPSSSISAAHT